MAPPFHLVFLLCLTGGLLISGTWSARNEPRARGWCPGGWTPVGNRCFIARGDRRNMRDAERSCRWLGGSLASIHSWWENYMARNLLRRRFGRDVEAWIGLNDQSRERWWRWTDGSRVDYTAWRSGEPNNHGWGEDCVAITHPSGPGWNDATCGDRFPYICARNR